jgi:putative ABC transport system substrate-binding protein
VKKALAIVITGIMVFGMLTGCTSSESVVKTEVYTIGIVQPMDHPSLNQIRDTIVSEIHTQGLGDKVEITLQNANGDMNLLQSIMQNLVGEGVDMIVPIATPSAQAAVSATSQIPIIFSAVSNPVEAGLVKSFTETTGNITGVSNSIPVADIFELSRLLTPEVKTYGLIYNSSEINSSAGIEKAKTYCDENGIAFKEASITGTADLHQAVSSLIGEVDAFFTPNDNTVASAMATYVQIASDAGVPIYVGADSMVKDGGLATVGIDYTVLGKQTAMMIIRIIEGESIGDNPVETVSEYAKIINMGIAEKLNINIPAELEGEFVIVGK